MSLRWGVSSSNGTLCVVVTLIDSKKEKKKKQRNLLKKSAEINIMLMFMIPCDENLSVCMTSVGS